MRNLRWSLPILLYFTLVAVPIARADSGQYWCRIGYDWHTYTSIPVYINAVLPAWSQLPALSAAGWEAHVLNGCTAPTPNNGASISIRTFTGCTASCWRGITWGSPGSGGGGVKITLGDGTVCPTMRQTHWLYNIYDSNTSTFGGLLGHELMHAVGFNHFDVCQTGGGPPPCQDTPGEPFHCSEMYQDGLTHAGVELEYSDWNALRTLYGTRTPPSSSTLMRESSDNGITWTSRSSNAGFYPFGSASWSGLSQYQMPLVTIDTWTDPHYWLWNQSSSAFTDYSYIGVSPQVAPLSASIDGNRIIGFFTSVLSEGIAYKQPVVSYTSTPGVYTMAYSSIYASRQGIGGTWDPKTARYIHVMRDYDNSISMALSSNGVAGTASVPPALQGAYNGASFLPSISCSPASTMTYNCVMVWASAPRTTSGDLFHVLKWTQFRVLNSGGTYSLDFPNSVYSVGYIQYAPPVVTYTGNPTGSSSFVVAWKVPGRCVFSLHKDATPTSTFTGETSHCLATGTVGPPMIGTANGKVELWAPLDK